MILRVVVRKRATPQPVFREGSGKVISVTWRFKGSWIQIPAVPAIMELFVNVELFVNMYHI